MHSTRGSTFKGIAREVIRLGEMMIAVKVAPGILVAELPKELDLPALRAFEAQRETSS